MDLKVDLFRYYNVIFGKVLSMPRSIKRGSGTIYKYEDYEISSVSVPELRNKTVYLFGKNKIEDDTVISYHYNTAEDAEKALLKFQYMIEQINVNNNVNNEEVKKNKTIIPAMLEEGDTVKLVNHEYVVLKVYNDETAMIFAKKPIAESIFSPTEEGAKFSCSKIREWLNGVYVKQLEAALGNIFEIQDIRDDWYADKTYEGSYLGGQVLWSCDYAGLLPSWWYEEFVEEGVIAPCNKEIWLLNKETHESNKVAYATKDGKINYAETTEIKGICPYFTLKKETELEECEEGYKVKSLIEEVSQYKMLS